MDHPTGNVTFLFTDIEGSTRLSQKFTEYYSHALTKHNLILHDAVKSNSGFVFKTFSGTFCCAFHNADNAVKAAYDIQRSMLEENRDDAIFKVKIGIHTGLAEWTSEDYMGYIALARTARIMSVANGEQIIISNDAYESINEKNFYGISYRDLGDRRLKDVIQPVKLFQVNGPGLHEEFAPLKTLDARPNNLPVQLTSFIGREEEIKEIKKHLTASRLVTLLGTGGAGKTRLSVQVAADLIDDFTDGVWLIELAPLSDPDHIAQTIANVFKLQSTQNQSMEQTLINFLSEKEILLIFDNCEHLINSCASISEMLLKNSPGLKILGSSREVLHCSGEKIHHVLPLKFPEQEEKITPFELSQYEAARLFIERALTVNKSFRINIDNAQALSQICFHLDGIPLAIELAAARTSILSVEKISERLKDRFRLLTGGKRTDSPRQQTLRSLIDWSYNLLSEKEKILFNKLSVFAGGWTLNAAERICFDESIACQEVGGLLTSLSEKSLINTTERSGYARFYLLESLKEYGSEKITDKFDLFKKHFEYYSVIACQDEMSLKGLDQIEWVKEAKSEIENIRQAVRWSVENDTEKAAKIVYDTGVLYTIFGYVMEGHQNCMKILEKNLFPDERSKAYVQHINGTLLIYLGNYIESDIYTNESLKVFRKLNMKSKIASSLNNLGHNAFFNSDLQKQKEYYDESLSISTENNFYRQRSETLVNLADNVSRSGNTELSISFLEQARIISQERKFSSLTIGILSELAIIELDLGNFDKAMLYAEESLELARQMDNQNYISINLTIFSRIYFKKKIM